MQQGSIIQGIVLYTKPLVRGTTYLEVLSEERGKVRAVARLEKHVRASSIVGRRVECENTSRMHAEMPFFLITHVCEEASFLSILDAPLPLLVWKSALDVCRLSPESEECKEVVQKLLCVRDSAVNHARGNIWIEAYLSLELCVLRTMGFGLSICECTVTKSRTGLSFISPRTGAAVVQKVGKPYAQRLLKYPEAFSKMAHRAAVLSDQEFFEALTVIGFFLQKYSRRALVREQMMLWKM